LENVLTFTVLVLAICLAAVALTLNEKNNQLTKRHDREMSAVSKEITRLIRLVNTTREELAALESKVEKQAESQVWPDLEVESNSVGEPEPQPSASLQLERVPPSIFRSEPSGIKPEPQGVQKNRRVQREENPAIVAERHKQLADQERARKAKQARRLQAALAQHELGETEYFVFFLKRAYKIRRVEAENLCLKLDVHGKSRNEPHFKLDYIKNEIFRRWSGADEELEPLRIWLDKIKAKADDWESRQAGFTGFNSASRIEALEVRQNNRYGD
jgi:hypothetical protein